MKRFFPAFKCKTLETEELLFTGSIQPRRTLPVYDVTIHYRGCRTPIVKIIKPKLVENPPHFYHATNSICLFKPSHYSWEANKLIAKVIVPWTASWIYFYEMWLQNSNIWLGPEASHDAVKIINDE
ncbi:MAG: hypothetical protein WKF85_15620 [Chitinophagaceae bacterium]